MLNLLPVSFMYLKSLLAKLKKMTIFMFSVLTTAKRYFYLPAHQFLLNQLNGSVRFACHLLFIYFFYLSSQTIIDNLIQPKRSKVHFHHFSNQISRMRVLIPDSEAKWAGFL